MTESPDSDSPALQPAAQVGRKVRRRNRIHPKFTAWAQIVMTVPSRDGLCWMVTFIDGDIDVWRVDDPNAHYQFAPR